jgi:Fe-S-cluster containining protein
MNELELPPGLRGTSIEEPLRLLQSIYAEAQDAMDAFRAASGLDCLPGCGECCKGFEPDIRPAEALYMAAWLLGPGEAKIGMLEMDDGSGTCPFFSHDDPKHCQAYPSRFLICRLFGFCGMRGKNGETEFSRCFMLADEERFGQRLMAGEELLAAYGAYPPLMPDFGSRVAALFPDAIGSPEPVRQALAAALSKLRLLLSVGKAGIAAGEAGPEEGGA